MESNNQNNGGNTPLERRKLSKGVIVPNEDIERLRMAFTDLELYIGCHDTNCRFQLDEVLNTLYSVTHKQYERTGE